MNGKGAAILGVAAAIAAGVWISFGGSPTGKRGPTPPPGPQSTAGLPAQGGLAIPWTSEPRPVVEGATSPTEAGQREIRGRVVEAATGSPVPDARIHREYRAEETRTDGDGRFLLRVSDREETVVVAEAAGFVAAKCSVDGSLPGAMAPLLLELLRPGTVSGRVTVAGTGEPAAGATVVVLPDIAPVEIPRGGMRAAAGSDGRYEVRDIPPGQAVVLVAGGEFVSRTIGGPGPWTEKVDTVEIPVGAPVERDIVVVAVPRVRGRILDAEGRGVPGATVVLEPVYDGQFVRRPPWQLYEVEPASTGPAGTFRLPFLLPGFPHRILVRRGESSIAAAALPSLAPGEEKEILLRMEPERWIDVQVVELEGGAPMAGIDVDASAGFLEDRRLDSCASGTSGPDGRVRIGPAPTLPLWVTVHGHSPWWTSGRVEVGPQDTGPVVVQVSALDRPGVLTIRGTVVLPDGTPAADAEWTATPAERENCLSDDWYRGRTDIRGQFQSGGFRPGRVQVRAWTRRDGREFSILEIVEAEAPDPVFRLEDRDGESAGLTGDERGAGIRVRILDSQRRPVEGGQVLFHFAGQDGSGESLRRQPCGGLCAMPVSLPGAGAPFHVEIEGAWDRSIPQVLLAHSLFGPFPAREGEIEVVLCPGLTLEGRVVESAGKDIPKADVRLDAEFEAATGVAGGLPLEGETIHDDAGHFRIEGLGPFAYEVSAESRPEFKEGTVHGIRAGAKDLVIFLDSAPETLVTVLEGDGKPVRDARVHVTGSTERTDAKGIARFHSLDPEEEYSLEVNPPGDRDDLCIEKRDTWKPADTVVHLAPGFVVDVVVRDPAGAPVQRAVVRLRTGEEWKSLNGATDDEGRIRLCHLPVGPWSLRAMLAETETAGHGPACEAIVPAGASTATLTLDMGLEMRVRVKGSRTRMGVFAWLGAPGETEAIRRISYESGDIVLRGLAKDIDYDLFVRDSDGVRSALLRGVRAGGGPLEVTLADGKEIRGRVLLREDDSLENVEVVVGDAALIEVGETESDGTFHFTGVPDGRWKVRCRLSTGDEGRTVEADVAAGGTVEIDAR